MQAKFSVAGKFEIIFKAKEQEKQWQRRGKAARRP
jgi:hypothetical protein